MQTINNEYNRKVLDDEIFVDSIQIIKSIFGWEKWHKNEERSEQDKRHNDNLKSMDKTNNS